MGEFAIKVSPFSGEYSGGALRGKDTSCGWGWCEPILVGGLTYIGRHRDLYSFIVGPILVAPLTYIGRYCLPTVGVVTHTAESVRAGVKQCPSKQLCKTH